MNTIHVVAIGAPVVAGIYLRYCTWNTNEQFQSAKWTILSFLALVFGVILLAPEKSPNIVFGAFNNFFGKFDFNFASFVCGASIYLMYSYFKNYGAGFGISEIISSIIVGIISMIALRSIIEAGIPWRKSESIFSLSSFMLIAGVASIGFFHSLAGPIVAGMNVAALIKSLITDGDISDFWNITSLLEIMELNHEYLKKGVFVASTGLGLIDSYEYMKKYI
jgi:hypothetical protein